MVQLVRWGLFALLLIAATQAAAQQQVTQVDASGKILEIAPNLITVKTIANQVIYGSLDPARKEGMVQIQGMPNLVVEVNGELSVGDLQRGAIVRFTIELDMRKQVGEVSQVAVLGMVEPPNVSLGMIPEGGEDLGKKKPTSGKFIVVGRIESARAGYLEVEFPGGKQKAKLAAETTVQLTASDLTFARPGDDIRIEGGYIALPRVHVFKATITRAKTEKKPVGRTPPAVSKSPATTKKPRGDDEKPDGFGVGDPRADAPPAAAVAGETVRPKEKGKVLKVN